MINTNKFKVRELKNGEYKQWILKKHYAKRSCSVSYCFGLIEDTKIIGVCTFGFPPNFNYNDGKCIFSNYKCLTLELNRLVINNNKEKNLASFFVSRAIKFLPKPSTIVSYADPNQNHKGYVYQALNWIYTGVSTPKKRYTFKDGSTFDIRRGIDTKGEIVKIEELLPTHRYIFFHADRTDRKKMRKNFKLKIVKYPKGDNKKYKCIDIDMYYQNSFFDVFEEL